jgi:thymidine phosphorylase
MAVTNELGAHMLMLGGVASDRPGAIGQLKQAVASGAALRKFREIVAAQGGDVRVVDDPARLPQARLQIPLAAGRAGFVADVDAMGVALAALRLGAGRAKAEDRVDPAVGVGDLVKIGEPIAPGAPLCVIHANDEDALTEARAMLERAIVIGDRPGIAPKLIDEVIG